jgi:hypothetical protein
MNFGNKKIMKNTFAMMMKSKSDSNSSMSEFLKSLFFAILIIVVPLILIEFYKF